jgi:hypothetical protein
MELLDRYLEAVKQHLPRKQQDDIIQELSVNIRERIDVMESSQGRPLNDTELESLLKEYGNPVLLAASYQPRHDFIFAMFPFFWRIARLVLSITGLIYLLVIASLAISGRPFLRLVGIGALTLLAELGWMVIVFFLLDRFHLLDKWQPRALPPLKTKTHGVPTIPGLIFNAAFCFYGLLAVKFPVIAFGPFFRFAPIWHQLYLPLTLFVVLSLWVQGFALFRPQATRLLRFADLLTGLAGLALCGALLSHAQELFVPTPSPWSNWIGAIAVGNVIAIYLGLLIAAVCFGIEILLVLVREIRHLASSEKNRLTSTV